LSVHISKTDKYISAYAQNGSAYLLLAKTDQPSINEKALRGDANPAHWL